MKESVELSLALSGRNYANSMHHYIECKTQGQHVKKQNKISLL